jgi:hypothetical protein
VASDDSAQPRSTMAHSISRSASLRYFSREAGDSCSESQALPLYLVAKALLPTLAISQQNLHHYASLANFYTVVELQTP